MKYRVEFESKLWHGTEDMGLFTIVSADSVDEAKYLAESNIEKRLASLGYENDPGVVTNVEAL